MELELVREEGNPLLEVENHLRHCLELEDQELVFYFLR